MQYVYYPGCSLKGTGRAYEESVLAVFDKLGIQLAELEDWNCCGATAYMSVDEHRSFALAARNLALAERQAPDTAMVVPCSGCYLTLNKTCHIVKDYPEIAQEVKTALDRAGLEWKNRVEVRHPLDILVQDLGLDTIRQAVVRPLKGLKVAPYYGCQIVRPYSTFDHQIYPTSMDHLLEALGATVMHYPLKTKCCGGSMTGTVPEVGKRLSYILLNEAKKREADLMATVCPLCQFNLDAYARDAAHAYGPVNMPVVYFTQLMGLAFGLSAKQVGLQRNIVSAMGSLKKFCSTGAAGAAATAK
ncbi:CoB--CoM heterodisulfide reductase iron-sulfur subunit B family protein [Candidatus Sumerlaeota bacterium]|nr:CoB--CoM heterodisulfide reductase iron-sulfur subunit B family protein [Candidatus Sumerlaeota bacterium]